MIVDLESRDSGGWSATVDGDQVLLEVPLAAPIAAKYNVTVTATYRVLGKSRTVISIFAAA
jgi:hypothetical protein